MGWGGVLRGGMGREGVWDGEGGGVGRGRGWGWWGGGGEEEMGEEGGGVGGVGWDGRLDVEVE